MFTKLICLIFGVLLSGVNGGTTYDAAHKNCQSKFNLNNDEPIDHFLLHGKFPDGSSENLKCFFSCLAEELNLADSAGNLKAEKLKQLAEENQSVKELKAFSSDAVIKSCINRPETSPCEKVYSYVNCALKLQAEQASQQASEQASQQTSEQTSEQASEQASQTQQSKS